jgi:glycosyltransferase involved in cell wall biosynthesis
VKVSVIVPTHDTRYLKATLDSVAAQTYQDFRAGLTP